MRKIKFISSLVLALAALSSCQQRVVEINLDNSISKDASFAVHSALTSAKGADEVVITFEKGRYDFYPDKASERYCFISNHNDVLSRIAFNIEDAENITINGNGSEFIFHGLIIPFHVLNSSQITIENLSIDWDSPFHSESLVVASNEEEHYFDIAINEGERYEIRDEQLFFVKPYYEHTIGQSILFDPKTDATAFQTELSTPIATKKLVAGAKPQSYFTYPYKMDYNEQYLKERGWELRAKAKEIEPGIVRVTGHNKRQPQVGMVLACKGEHGYNRLAPAVQGVNVTDFTANNVTVHNACGMGFLFENSENVSLTQCVVTPSGDRLVSTTADASHFVGCRGLVHLSGCTFTNQLDDALNVHGAYQEIVDIIAPNVLGIRVGHFQQKGFVVARPDDTIGFVRLSDSFYPFAENEVEKVEVINGRYHIITFKEAIPSSVKCGDLVENLNAYPELIVEDCHFRGNRARGVLLSTPKRIIIQNNTFETEMEPILVPVESSFWFESGGVADLLIKNNTFVNALTSGQDRGLIRFVTDDDNANTAFRNVEIVGNKFIHSDNWIIEASNIDGLLIKDNVITTSDAYPKQYENSPAFSFKHSKNVVFENNTYEGDAETLITTTPDMNPLTFE